MFAFFTCGENREVSACPAPDPGSNGATTLAEARSLARFPLRYPCVLPGGATLTTTTVLGEPGRQQVELIFDGPFEMAIRQAQFPPLVNPDPAGTSRSVVDLFPNVQATFIQRNDGSRRALYHLFWDEGGIYYELQAAGPPIQQRLILQIARSLQ